MKIKAKRYWKINYVLSDDGAVSPVFSDDTNQKQFIRYKN